MTRGLYRILTKLTRSAGYTARKVGAPVAYPYFRYNYRHNLIFVHIPKCADTSILRALDYQGSRNHVPASFYAAAIPIAFSKFTKFAIVRHPVSRCHSAYRYLLQGGNGSVPNLRLQETLRHFDGFNDFVENFLTVEVMVSHKLFWPQVIYTHNAGDSLVDHVFKQDDLLNDTKFLGLASRFPNPVKHLNVSTGEAIQGQLTETAHKILLHLYESDFNAYNFNQSRLEF